MTWICLIHCMGYCNQISPPPHAREKVGQYAWACKCMLSYPHLVFAGTPFSLLRTTILNEHLLTRHEYCTDVRIYKVHTYMCVVCMSHYMRYADCTTVFPTYLCSMVMVSTHQFQFVSTKGWSEHTSSFPPDISLFHVHSIHLLTSNFHVLRRSKLRIVGSRG